VRINAVYDRFEFGLSKVAHTIAAAVLENMAPFEAHWRSILAAARPVVVEAAQALERDGLLSGPMPAHGCMYFPRLAAALDDVAVADWLWRQHNLAVAPGTYFGRPGHLRIGFGRSAANVADGMKRLHSGLEEYRKREQR
jgi:aspartate/methionine/tyrosine aminotransferase